MDPWVVEVLREGYSILFSNLSPLSENLIPFDNYSPTSIKGKALQREISSLIEKGTVELAPSFSRISQPHVRCYEGVKFVETNYRSLYPEQIYPSNQVEDGDQSFNPQSCSEGRLDNFHRSEGRLPSDSHLSREQEVPSFCCIQ